MRYAAMWDGPFGDKAIILCDTYVDACVVSKFGRTKIEGTGKPIVYTQEVVALEELALSVPYLVKGD